MSNSKLIVIVGPTASGKSKLAVRLARKFNGEIISADSRQVYKGMDIGTAKQRNGLIPCHLIDIIEPDQRFNAAMYKKLAIRKIKEIQKRKKLPFIVGGTGLYIKAIVDNIKYPMAPPNKKLRKELEKKSAKELFLIYKKLDRKGAKLIDRRNKRRLIRALEVCKITGRPFWQQRKKNKSNFETLQIGIETDRKKLKEKIEKRVEKMFKLGLENEVKTLIKEYGWETPALQSIGYQEWKEYFEGKSTKKEVKNKIIKDTWQYAKRQLTWFKKDKKVCWVDNYRNARNLVSGFTQQS